VIDTMGQDMLFWRSAYRSHGPAVMSFLVRRLGRREDAEDLLQETFVRAIGSDSFAEGGNLRAYLMRIAHNLMVNRLRRPRLVVPVETEEEAAFEGVASGGASPEQAAAWSDFRERLAGVLAVMSEAHRRAFELGVLEGRPYAEVAELTGSTLAQVEINIFRARKRVVEELREHLPPAGESTPRSTL
jgi:RNA polymerase sigma-70 factor, ECF subfamily